MKASVACTEEEAREMNAGNWGGEQQSQQLGNLTVSLVAVANTPS